MFDVIVFVQVLESYLGAFRNFCCVTKVPTMKVLHQTNCARNFVHSLGDRNRGSALFRQVSASRTIPKARPMQSRLDNIILEISIDADSNHQFKGQDCMKTVEVNLFCFYISNPEGNPISAENNLHKIHHSQYFRRKSKSLHTHRTSIYSSSSSPTVLVSTNVGSAT